MTETAHVKTFDSADDVTGEVKSALIDLLYRLADDDLVMGHRNSEWTGLAPILEADIAFSSIAQDQMGQALTYYRLLHDLGEADPDTLVFSRGAKDYRCAALVSLDNTDWAFSTTRLYLYETAKALRIEHLQRSAYAPLAALTRKFRGEQKYHLMHAKMWIARLGDATEESRTRMQSALDALFPHALGLFEPVQGDDTLAASSIAPREAQLCDTWRSAADDELSQARLKVPANLEPVFGGRSGEHPKVLTTLLDALRKVNRLDPAAAW